MAPGGPALLARQRWTRLGKPLRGPRTSSFFNAGHAQPRRSIADSWLARVEPPGVGRRLAQNAVPWKRAPRPGGTLPRIRSCGRDEDDLGRLGLRPVVPDGGDPREELRARGG